MLSAFTAGLLLITIAELGDKTFFIAAILATRHPRRWVFVGAIAALAAMTIISVLTGQVAGLLPRHYVKVAEVVLFLGFGLKMLYDALQMSGQETLEDECKEAAELLEESGRLPPAVAPWSIISKAFTLTFLAEWGDRTQIATITLAAGNNPFGVAIGATLGHAICAAIAVLFGKLVAGRLSEKTLMLLGGGLFIVFGLVAAFNIA
ncbi:TMEM165/GDT1 family protein [Pseudanabaena sp. FACHB-2040]|uniref:TMEM165/GDT1 family protein n=1 Tax=Pseudanabaena sp. FACHB-2040 TaxID=2692859 RepID=UPI001687ACB1|nr:TMEM165/GDT1 family protein [Pseudanabaena sp. FACHB-2040]MBD2256380.1 TMEM165/GDT1 family protein [Pseudanabaena sp. FACHB-2040]